MREINISPIGKNVIVELIDQKISDVIHIPDSAKDNKQQTIARVLAIGPGVKADLKLGNVILGHRYMEKVHGPSAKIGDNLYVCPESEILAILEDYDGNN